MEIICVPVAFHRWEATLKIDGEVYGYAIGPRPGCAIRDAINEFCLKHDGMPDKMVKLTISEWE